MQNKGFVITLASLLFLICAFYLSFSFVTSRYEDRAREYAQGDSGKYYDYMDSVSSEKVWMGYTLKECREKEINLGLDLKGGMNVTLEVSVADVVRALSDYNTNANFNKALSEATKRQIVSGDNFLKLFQEEFEKIDPNARLAGIFSTYDFKDRISSSATNDKVIAVLQEEVDAAIANSFNVLRTRIDRFGVVQPNIQQLDKEGRILVELPGVKEPERVRKLLQGSANLEFWETFKYSEIAPQLEAANNIIRELNKAKTEESAVAEADVKEEAAPVAETIVDEAAAADNAAADNASADSVVDDEVEQVLSSIANDTTADKTADDQMSEEEIRREYPLFSRLQPQQNNGPVLGLCRASDTAEVNSMLALKQVAELFPRELRFKWTVKPINPEDKVPYYQLIAIKCSNRDGRAPLSGDVITDARDDFSQYSASSNVSMNMNAEGSKIWARLTKENIGREIAIVLDNYVYSFPTVNTEITGGSSEISGHFTPEEAKDLANVLKSGKMPAPARIIQEDVVGPSLGEQAIQSGLISFVIAFVLVLVYMMFYYGLVPGLIADGALLLNVLFLFGILASFRAVLTLPGIAGIVLTLGMAVDANVLIYERIREELRSGKNFKSAVNDGYSNAFSAIADANITTLITGIILVYFGTGPVKGFATTLIIGIITSVFTSVFITRVIYDFIVKSEKDRSYPFTTNITKKWFQNINYDFIGKRKIGYIISCCIILIAVVSLSFRGLKQGIDFSGGRNYVVRFEQPINTDEIRETLSHVFTEAQTSVITMGSENQIRVSTNYMVASDDDQTDAQIEDMLYNALKPYMAEGITKEMFLQRYVPENGDYRMAQLGEEGVTFGVQSSQKVGPTIASDIKTSAIWAVLFSLLAIALYILIRFRNWGFSVGAVAALAHDVLFILGVYSIAYSIMPFSLEIDQAFIAAILTIIGYSINDTVVIFDRIRENLKLFPKRDLQSQLNVSLNSTLSRTFSTSLSTAIVLLAIFFFGGETIRGFVFAILLGVVEGVYSTLFVATPLAYEIQSRQRKKLEEKK